MGYYTTYNLTWKSVRGLKDVPNCEHTIPPKAKFCPECATPVGTQSLDDRIKAYLSDHKEEMYGIMSDGSQADACKWYDWEKDARAMSKQFPGVLFTLSGEGEESGDIWKAYFLDGKCQVTKAELKFEPYDPKKLK